MYDNVVLSQLGRDQGCRRWLRGLGQNEAGFRENEIDDEVLVNLTAEDLRGTVTLPKEERDISRPLGTSGSCDRGPPRGH